jgi:hypothetical protein
MPVLYANNAASRLAASITNVATSFSVTAGHGAKFPAISGGDYFYATLMDSAGNLEVVKVTARATDTFTVTRAQESTTARAYAANDIVELRITKAMLDDFKTDTRAGNAATATALQTGRTIAMTGDVSYTSGSFNGSANVTGTATLANSGVTAGTYTKVTVNSKGLATSGTTLAASDIPELTMEKLPSAAYKQSVRCTTTGNITLSGTQTIDGISVVAGNRVLVRFQVIGSQNGIYVVAAGAWSRAADADSATEIAAAIVRVDSGTTHGGKLWTTTFKTTDTIGTTVMNWHEVVYNSGSWGISISGSSGSTTGNAATATTLQTARTIGGVSFNGSANINLPGVNAAGNQSTTGNAATATALQNARTIGGVSFNGTANINLPGVNAAGNQNTTGSAATLTTARSINGTSFNGSADITTANWGTARTLTVGNTGKSVNGSANVSWSLAEIGAAAAVHYHAGLLHRNSLVADANTALTEGTYGFGAASGLLNYPWADGYGKLVVTVNDGGTHNNASNWIWQVLNDTSGRRYSRYKVNAAGWTSWALESTGATWNGTAAVATAATVTTSATASAFKVPFANTTASTTGNYGLLQDSEATFTYNPSTNTLVVGTVSGALSGNATTATTLQTARTIGGVSFNGSANINLPGVNAAGNQNTTGTAANVTGIVAVANGGTGATTGAAAIANLGAFPTAGGTFAGGVVGITSGGTTLGAFAAQTTGGAFSAMWTRYGAFRTFVNHTGSSYAPSFSVFYEYTGAYAGHYSIGHLTTSAANPGNLVIQHINSVSGAQNLWLFDGLNGNFTAGGSVTQFSDERMKSDWSDVPTDFLERLALVKSGTYTNLRSGERQAGASAQGMQALIPEVVSCNNHEQMLTLAYGNAALVSAIELAKRLLAAEKEIAVLKELTRGQG